MYLVPPAKFGLCDFRFTSQIRIRTFFRMHPRIGDTSILKFLVTTIFFSKIFPHYPLNTEQQVFLRYYDFWKPRKKRKSFKFPDLAIFCIRQKWQYFFRGLWVAEFNRIFCSQIDLAVLALHSLTDKHTYRHTGISVLYDKKR